MASCPGVPTAGYRHGRLLLLLTAEWLRGEAKSAVEYAAGAAGLAQCVPVAATECSHLDGGPLLFTAADSSMAAIAAAVTAALSPLVALGQTCRFLRAHLDTPFWRAIWIKA
ncbi:hypothetical protein HK405_001598, partial [Cladochytrium tenue]